MIAGRHSPKSNEASVGPVTPGHRADEPARGALHKRRRQAEAWSGVAAVLLVVWFYHWTVWANTGFEDWGDQDYYRLLVRGWRKGQLALDKQPSRELLALADPYDPAQN